MSVATLHEMDNSQATAPSLASEGLVWPARIEALGRHLVRYGLVLVLVWIGAMKFTEYEAQAISGLVANSPLMSWAYQVFSTRQFSALIGVVELLIGVLIASRPLSARLAAIGGMLAAGMFLTTLSFLITTPGAVEPSLGFPALSAMPGQFLIKDIVLLGAAVWCTGEALQAARLGCCEHAACACLSISDSRGDNRCRT